MIYGAHNFLFTERWSDSDVGILDLCSELGLGILEIAVGDDVVFEPNTIRRRAGRLGMELAISPGGEWPLACDLSSESREEREAGYYWHRANIDRAAACGAVAYCGALYGHPGVVKRRRPPADELPRVAEGLHRLAEYASRLGVLLALEPMSHFRTHLMNTPRQLMRLLDVADHDNLYGLFDTYHMITEIRDYAAGIRELGDRLWAVHACENDRGAPGGGIVPWGDVSCGLSDIDFAGCVVMETYNSSIGDFAYRRGMFHDVCPDGRDFVRRGLSFLRQCLE